MNNPTTRERLATLRQRLDQVNRRWTVDNHSRLLEFYVRMLPRALGASRCTIYMVDPRSDRIWSLYGTGLETRAIQAPREGSVAGQVIGDGRTRVENAMDSRKGYHTQVDEQTGFVTRNTVCAAIKSAVGQRVLGAIQVLNKDGGSDFAGEDARAVEEVSAYLCMAVENILINHEILAISSRLDSAVESLRQEGVGSESFIAESPAMQEVMDQVRTVGPVPVNVLIQGENGTGKELVARMIHAAGERDGAFVAVNCAAIPENLMESEFFGYRKGAFTGAVEDRSGRFEEASGGTLFLDEVADMPLAMQPKFLRALQESEGTRLGDKGVTQYDLRLISASNKDLRQAVASGQLREDLYYRLFSVEVNLPPLRERRQDIRPMALSFLDRTARLFEKHVDGFSPALLEAFLGYRWPGNVRQLRREVERLVALTPEGEAVKLDAASAELRGAPDASDEDTDNSLPSRVRALEIGLIRTALREHEGNRERSAAALGISRQGLHKKMKRYGVEPD